MSEKTFLSIRNLSKSFPEGGQLRRVLDRACLDIPRGEFTAILGKSGSGKSTLLNILSGIDYQDSGQIWLDSREITALEERQRTLFRRHHIGFVFQFFNLIPTLTVWENVLLPAEINGDPRSADSRGTYLLSEVGLLDRKDAFPDTLSGGEQQRVALARALVHDPLLVLADEPTGNLDADTGEQVLQLLDRLTRKAGKNLIMATHSRSAAAYADRVLRLQDGRLVEQ